MKHQFESVLSKAGITTADLVKPGQKYVNDINKLVSGIDYIEADLGKENLSSGKKQELQTKLATAKDALKELDGEFVVYLTKWIPNREKNKAQHEKLVAGQLAKKNAAAGGQTVNTTTVPAATKPAAAAAATPAAATPATTKATATPAASTETAKKKEGGISVWGWIGLGLLTAALGTAGYKIWQSRRG